MSDIEGDWTYRARDAEGRVIAVDFVNGDTLAEGLAAIGLRAPPETRYLEVLSTRAETVKEMTMAATANAVQELERALEWIEEAREVMAALVGKEKGPQQ